MIHDSDSDIEFLSDSTPESSPVILTDGKNNSNNIEVSLADEGNRSLFIVFAKLTLSRIIFGS